MSVDVPKNVVKKEFQQNLWQTTKKEQVIDTVFHVSDKVSY